MLFLQTNVNSNMSHVTLPFADFLNKKDQFSNKDRTKYDQIIAKNAVIVTPGTLSNLAEFP